MLHWKNRFALILVSLGVVASAGGGFFSAYGFYW
jgi:hypothetical protein